MFLGRPLNFLVYLAFAQEICLRLTMSVLTWVNPSESVFLGNRLLPLPCVADAQAQKSALANTNYLNFLLVSEFISYIIR